MRATLLLIIAILMLSSLVLSSQAESARNLKKKKKKQHHHHHKPDHTSSPTNCPTNQFCGEVCLFPGDLCCNAQKSKKVGSCLGGQCLELNSKLDVYSCCLNGVCNNQCCSTLCTQTQTQCGKLCLDSSGPYTCCEQGEPCTEPNSVCMTVLDVNGNQGNICYDCGIRGTSSPTTCNSCPDRTECPNELPQCCYSNSTSRYQCIPYDGVCCGDGNYCPPGNTCVPSPGTSPTHPPVMYCVD